MIRSARPAEAALLSDIAFRSKAYWGYDAALMELCRPLLTYTESHIHDGQFWVLDEPPVVGFYRLLPSDNQTIILEDLFIAPEAIGRGCGDRLFQHAVAQARQQGAALLTLEADPHAEGFYRKQGMERCGERPSTIFPNQALILMRLHLS
jgi:GNAT superfamily N-acetyltransferase